MNIRGTILFVALFSLSACTDSGEKKANAKKDYSELELSADVGPRRIFYRFPAPNDIINYIKTERLVFHKDFLNPTSNANKYFDSRLQQLNLGIYSADFAYITIFNSLSEASEYFKSVENLSYQIGLSSVFDEKLRSRVEDNEANMDSLSNIARESYSDMVNQLITNGNEKQLSIISAGGYIEVLYLALTQTDNIKSDLPLLRKVYEQRYGLENLTLFMRNFLDDPWISDLRKDLMLILDAFKLIEEKTISESKATSGQKGNFKLSGGAKEISISPANFKLLKNQIIEIRKKYTNPLYPK